MKVNILGTKYTIKTATRDTDVRLENCDGYVDTTTKEIVVDNPKPSEMSWSDMEDYKRKVVRHEVVHAFLYESGLAFNSWGKNEEVVDWIALQFPKMKAVFETLEVEK